MLDATQVELNEELDPQDDDSIALNEAAEYINNDSRVFNHMLTIRDGLMVCIKNG